MRERFSASEGNPAWRGRRGLSGAGLVVAAALFSCAHGPPKKPGQLFADVVFDRYSTLSSNDELIRRMMTPLTQKHGREMLEATGQKI